LNLPSSNNLDHFLSENNENFRDTLLQLTLQRLYTTTGLSKAALAKQSGISEVYLHQLFSGCRFPSRNRLLCVCFGLGASVEDAQGLLRQARHALRKQLYRDGERRRKQDPKYNPEGYVAVNEAGKPYQPDVLCQRIAQFIAAQGRPPPLSAAVRHSFASVANR